VRQTQGGDTTDNNGIGDITLALKWRFFGEKEGLQFAIKPYVTFPTGDEEKGHGYGREAYGIRLISTFDREAWCVNVNLGYLYNEYGLQSNRDAYRPDIWYAGLSGQLRVVEKLGLVGEAAVARNPDVTPTRRLPTSWVASSTRSRRTSISMWATSTASTSPRWTTRFPGP